MQTLGSYLAQVLEAYDVDTVFGIPGVHTVELYRGLPLTKIRHVTPRHEQGAGFMADGYARITGKPGVCLLITGPGLTNAATAIAQAYADSIPMLIITGVNAVDRMGSGRGWLHELKDQQAFATQITASSTTVYSRDDLDRAMANAFKIFAQERPRPVHIEIPTDIMRMPVDGAIPVIDRLAPRFLLHHDDALNRSRTLLAQAKTPLILVGGGAKGAAREITALAEFMNAPVVMTVNGRGILPVGHPLALPFNPSLRPIRDLMKESDVTLAIGTEFGPTDYDWYEDGGFDIPGTLIRIDIDPLQAARGVKATETLIGDARQTVLALRDGLTTPNKPSTFERVSATSQSVMRDELTPIYRASLSLLDLIHHTLPGVVIVGDSTQPGYAASVAYNTDMPGHLFGSMTGFGTLGYSLPAAIGARVARDQPVIALIGDGGIHFTISELGTAVEEQVPIIVIVWNNRGYGEIRNFMIEREIQPQGVDIGAPDLVKIAEGYGVHAEKLTTISDLPRLLKDAVRRKGPTLIDGDETLFLTITDTLKQ